MLFYLITNYFDHLYSFFLDGLCISQRVCPPSSPDLKSMAILHYISQSSLFLALTWSVCTVCWSSFVIFFLFSCFASSPPPHLKQVHSQCTDSTVTNNTCGSDNRVRKYSFYLFTGELAVGIKLNDVLLLFKSLYPESRIDYKLSMTENTWPKEVMCI